MTEVKDIKDFPPSRQEAGATTAPLPYSRNGSCCRVGQIVAEPRGRLPGELPIGPPKAANREWKKVQGPGALAGRFRRFSFC